jgi:hypothetical protein
MTSRHDVLLANELAHLPHYTHSATIVGSVIILAITTLVAGVALAIAHHLVSTGPTTPQDHSRRLHCVEQHQTSDAIPVPVSHVARAWEKQKNGGAGDFVLTPCGVGSCRSGAARSDGDHVVDRPVTDGCVCSRQVAAVVAERSRKQAGV